MKTLETITRALRVGLYLLIAAYFVLSVTNYHAKVAKHVYNNEYNPGRVCPDAWEQQAKKLNQHDDEDIPYFDVPLQTGCFSGYVHFPKRWQRWGMQFMNPEQEGYVAFWWNGWAKPNGPFPPNALPNFDYPPSSEFRLQGTGTIRFFKIQ
jgi:hypothetical protein